MTFYAGPSHTPTRTNTRSIFFSIPTTRSTTASGACMTTLGFGRQASQATVPTGRHRMGAWPSRRRRAEGRGGALTPSHPLSTLDALSALMTVGLIGNSEEQASGRHDSSGASANQSPYAHLCAPAMTRASAQQAEAEHDARIADDESASLCDVRNKSCFHAMQMCRAAHVGDRDKQ
ncbi:hypothetical protein Micbo1qcDRAFT_172765 [Microdochium bolleyi]|uniref:Uncharacterized protein n=1 Tax=Microdochium bolleyi TaxID=196109 RepID=A0A136J9R3_9PEZI|nr:hypothetical protein Micbo1qcDRAFT_172765 [Microdochium bolleyi]